MAIAAVAVIYLPACSNGSSQSANESASDSASVANEQSTTIAAGPVTEITPGTANLDAYSGKLTVVVDFNAVWCGPCRNYAPTFHDVAEKMATKASFLSVNVDSCPEIAAAYVQQYIPQTTVILPDGRKFDKIGALSEEELTAFVDSVASL